MRCSPSAAGRDRPPPACATAGLDPAGGHRRGRLGRRRGHRRAGGAGGAARWPRGGIAAALGPGDSPEEHLRDTLTAGAGICEAEAVRALVTDCPPAVRRLISLGARFDTDPAGPLALTREGGHLRSRIAHAGGGATGAEISRALLQALADAGLGPAGRDLDVIEHALALDLLLTSDGRAAGITLHVIGEGDQDGIGAVHARAVVLATGGIGQVYSATTNPPVSTGDGLALALRAGAGG